MARGLAAVTGATGFLGRHIVRALAEDGWAVRILARRDPIHPLWRGLEPQVAIGALEDPQALARLCEGAHVVVHAAGLVKAPNQSAFQAVNAGGVRSLAAAADRGAHFLLISSLAARSPELSAYAASKRAGEEAARAALGARLTILRPTAVYGPGDVATLGLFRAAQSSPLLPVFHPKARITLVHAQDAARQIAALAAAPPAGGTFALCDARPDGYGWSELMGETARACGSQPRLARIPEPMAAALAWAGWAVSRARGGAPMLTPDKLREMLHRDWSVAPEELAPAAPKPRFGLADGLRDTLDWYRQAGWLRSERRQFGNANATKG